MAKITQIIVTEDNVGSKNILKEYAPVTKIGIQAEQNTKFYFNDEEKNIIQMGAYGIYELDLTDLGYITSLKFDTNNIELPIYVDIVYHGEGEVS